MRIEGVGSEKVSSQHLRGDLHIIPLTSTEATHIFYRLPYNTVVIVAIRGSHQNYSPRGIHHFLSNIRYGWFQQ